MKILKLVVTRSSSLQVAPPSADGYTGGLSFHFYSNYPDVDFFTKKELAGRTMEFTFDVSQTPIIGRRILLKNDSDTATSNAYVLSGDGEDGNKPSNCKTGNITKVNDDIIHTNNISVSTGNGSGNTNKSINNQSNCGPTSPRRSASLSPADSVLISGWKRPWMSQARVRECLVNLLTTCGQRVGLPKSPSVSHEQTLKVSE